MNDFDRLKEIEQRTGNVVELMKDIEMALDNIILDYINPNEIGFTRDVILNSSILSIGNKIKIIKTIFHELEVKQDFQDLHKLMNIRNVFAHGKPYFEDEGMIFKLSEIKSDGKIQENELDKLYKEFIDLFNEQNQKLCKLQSKIKTFNGLCRLFYIDIMFNQYTNSKEFKPEFIENKLSDLEEESKRFDIDEMEKKINSVNNQNLVWFNRFKNKSFSYANVDVNVLIIEKEHGNLDDIGESSGKKIKEFFDTNQNNEEVKKRVDFIIKYFNIITKHLKVVVNRVNGLYEIMSGNHRAMAFIKKGQNTVPVLVMESSKK